MTPPTMTPRRLTERELEVIKAYRRRGSYEGAAIELDLSVHTVKIHLANARKRCGVRRTWQLFDFAA